MNDLPMVDTAVKRFPMLTAYLKQDVSDLNIYLINSLTSAILINGKGIARPICCVSHQFPKGNSMKCGCSSVVERHLAKVNVARSNRVTRLKNQKLVGRLAILK